MDNIYKKIVEKILASTKIIITAHKSPDGDSIGSSLALLRFVRNLGREAIIVHPDPVSPFLKPFLKDDQIVNFKETPDQSETLLSEAEIIFMLDYNAANRLGDEMGLLLENSSATKIMIDHHLHPSEIAEITVSDTSSCSTAQLIFELIDRSGNLHLFDEKIGEAIYLGILTDSGSFRFPSVQSRTHEILAHILNAGVKHHLIHEEIYDNNTLSRLKLRAFITNENLNIYENYKTAVLYVTDEEKKRFNYEDGDTEGLVNVALSIQGITRAAFFNENDGKIKISFRSKGSSNPVNTIASDHFSGGGHANAAGGVSHLPLKETIEQFLKVLPQYI